MINNDAFPSERIVEGIRQLYPAGCRVELVEMNDPYTKLLPGEQGTVDCVDAVGTIFVHWDCGSHLGVAYGADRIRKL